MSDFSPPQISTSDRLRRWIGPALLISLVINLFLVGMIATAMIVHRPGKHMDFRAPPPSFFGMMKRGAADLPPEDRAAMRDIMVQQFPIIRPYFAKIDAARRDLADVIAANPYNPTKVGAAFAEIDTAQADMVKATRAAMIEGFGKMSDVQRARLAEAMRKQADRRLKNARDDASPEAVGKMDRQPPLPLGPSDRPPLVSDGAKPHPDQGPTGDVPPMISDALGLGAPPPPPPGTPFSGGGSSPSNGLGFSGNSPPPGPVPFNGPPPR